MTTDTAGSYHSPASDVPVPSSWTPAPAPADGRDAVEPFEIGDDWTGPQIVAWGLSAAITGTLLTIVLI